MVINRSVFVICRKNASGGPNYYAAHGSMGGVEDAIGYDEKMFARKFLTEDSAQAFIRDELPEWGRSIHHPKEMTPCEIMIDCPELFVALLENDDEKICLALEPPGARMLIWRR
ncbi:hypothetical protein SDC9_165389 [bioreactor metagenome]|uniref:Uncharacterized protein n=1 Tax=bioreactor metagenome TaxID=1076179 RepID=A0A645FU70_9ZZZZ